MSDIAIGSIVRCRNREWVLLPSPNEDLYLLRPLTGSDKEICGIDKRLANLGIDPIEPAIFPLPKPEDIGDFIGTELLWNAARLSLREGAGPFRSFGKISVRPRAYQLVPLIMSLRLDPVRLFIADDVGIGKTIEALLIARELLDRGEIRRFCVLCPPYLCDQWQSELHDKYHIEAVVIRSSTISQLERELPSQDQSVFSYYPFTVVSIDYAKSEAHKANFLVNCPELVIVDEVHGAAQPSEYSKEQQQRHELLKEIAKDPGRHLILLTATPHSGIEASFLSLLGLIHNDFARLNMSCISDLERGRLARHFVQRRRADVADWIGEKTPFPERDSSEETYDLSASYKQLFDRVYAFSSELVRSMETLTGWKKRIRFWTALALLRCTMSSPAAAIKALQLRGRRLGIELETEDQDYASYIYEETEKETVDVQP
ncbi:MAG: DEAD/DEAH box helicase, partial [Candidatus Aminicenantes bacterium]|nr:DEAD/DEAH box helicase [Candidatus Aminicenantes bacterium]